MVLSGSPQHTMARVDVWTSVWTFVWTCSHGLVE
jgi:hypothetical protein